MTGTDSAAVSSDLYAFLAFLDDLAIAVEALEALGEHEAASDLAAILSTLEDPPQDADPLAATFAAKA